MNSRLRFSKIWPKAKTKVHRKSPWKLGVGRKAQGKVQSKEDTQKAQQKKTAKKPNDSQPKALGFFCCVIGLCFGVVGFVVGRRWFFLGCRWVFQLDVPAGLFHGCASRLSFFVVFFWSCVFRLGFFVGLLCGCWAFWLGLCRFCRKAQSTVHLGFWALLLGCLQFIVCS